MSNTKKSYQILFQKSFFFFIFTLTASSTYTACSSSPVQSKTDSKADLAHYHKYQWIGQNEAIALRLQNPTLDYVSELIKIVRNPDLEERLRPIIELNLQRAGYTPSADGKPDFYVTYYGKAKNSDWVSSWSGVTNGINQVPSIIFPNFYRDKPRSYRDGLVYITLYDGKTQKPSWTGSYNTPDLPHLWNTPELATAVNQLITEFSKTG